MNQKGVTLIESLVVILVIGILLATIFTGYRGQNKMLVLQRTATKLVADIERAREMAMSAQGDGGSYSLGGYGMYFQGNWQDRYIIFADIDADRARSSSEDVSTIIIDDGIAISSLIPSNQLDVVFVPPSPDVYIEGGSDSASIRLIIEGNPSKYKDIIINSAGLIYVE